MSLELALGSKPAGLCAVVGHGTLRLTDATLELVIPQAPVRFQPTITAEDFAHLVRYWLTNTDLAPGDPRLQLVDDIQRHLSLVSGYNPGLRHYQFDLP